MSDQLSLFAAVEGSFHTRGSRTTAHERAHGEAKAHEQESLILAFFREHPGPWAPSQVHAMLSPINDHGAFLWPLTSIRRAMTNLADRERYPHSLWPPLRKTEQRVDGPFGREEHTWELSEVSDER